MAAGSLFAMAWGQHVKQVTLSPTTVVGGASAKGTVLLSAKAPTGGMAVDLTSSNSAASVPKSVTVPTGATSTTFTVDTKAVASKSTATIDAKAGGSSTSAGLTIDPATLANLTIAPTSVVSGTSATGTVSLTGPAPTAGMKVSLSSNLAIAQAPSSVSVAANSTTATFTIGTTFTPTTATATITAKGGSGSVTAKLTITPGSPLALSPWPKFQADSANSGRAGLSGAEPKGKLAWSLNFYPGPYTDPIVGPDGSTYLVGSDWQPLDTVIAFDPTGTPKWRADLAISGASFLGGLAIGADGTVYATYEAQNGQADTAYLIAFDASGAQKWLLPVITSNTGEIRPNVPVIGPKGDIYPSTSSGLVAVSSTGRIEWTFKSGAQVEAPPTVAPDGTLYADVLEPSAQDQATLYALGPTGTIKWSASATTGEAAAVGPDGTVYVGNDDISELQAYSEAGALKWSAKYANSLVGPVLRSPGGDLYVWDGAHVRAFTSEGAGAWTYVIARGSGGSPSSRFALDADGAIYAINENDYLVALSPAGAKVWGLSVPLTTGQVVTGSKTGLRVVSNTAFTKTSPSFLGFGCLESVNPNGAKAWEYFGDAPVDAPAIASDGTLYIGGSGGNVYAVSSAGALKWTYQTGGPITSSPLVGWDNTVYVGANDGKLYAINSSGKQKWTFATGGPLSGSPAMGPDGTLYVGSSDGNLYAVTSAGQKKWSLAVGTGAGSGTPAVAPSGAVYIQAGAPADAATVGLYAVTTSGQLAWFSPLGGDGSPALAPDGTIYSFSIDYETSAVSPNGSSDWYKAVGDSPNFSVQANGDLQVDWAYTTTSLSKANGSVSWSSPWDSNYRSVIDRQGTIFLAHNESLIALQPDGTLKWSLASGDPAPLFPPIVGSGAVYVLSASGRLYAVD